MGYYLTILIGGLLASLGLSGVAVDTWSNVAFIAPDGPYLTSNVAIVVALATMAAVACAATGLALRRRQYFAALGLATGWMLATVFSLGATLDRVATQRDSQVQINQSLNASLVATRATIDDLISQRDEESKTGRGPRWKELNAQIVSLRTSLGALGSERVEDSSEARIEAITFGMVTGKQWRTIHPVTAPVGLVLLANALIALGASLMLSAQPVRRRVTIDITPVPTKLEEAKATIQRLADERGHIPALKVVVAETGIPKTTAYRALKLIA